MAKYVTSRLDRRPTRKEILAATPATYNWPASMPQALRKDLEREQDDYIVGWTLGVWDHARRGRLIAEELKQPPGWHCLSFATDGEFLGLAIVRGHGFVTAMQRAKELGWRDKHSGFLWVVLPHLCSGGAFGEIKHTTLTKQDMRHIPEVHRKHASPRPVRR